MFFNKTEFEIEESSEGYSAKELRIKLNSMRGTKASKKSIALSILRMLPFFNKFVDSLSGAGGAITHMVQVEGLVNHATEAAGTGFHIIKLVTSALDFIRIPGIYLGAYITNQEVPFSLSRNARFLYAAVLLGLTITAFAFPPAAPVIALVTSIAALGLSVITLAKLYYKRYELKDRLTQIDKNIDTKKNLIRHLIDDLEKLEADAKKAKNEGKIEEYKSLEEKIKSERDEIKDELKILQKLCDKQEHCKQKLEKLGMTAVMDRTAGIAFASLALIGAVVSLLFPPAGIGILAAVASLAAVYVIGRVTYPLFKLLVNKIVHADTKKTESDQEHPDEQKKDELAEDEFEDSGMRVKHDMDKIIKDAKRLEQIVADYPIIRSGTPSEITTPTLIPKKSELKERSVEEDVSEEDEHPSI